MKRRDQISKYQEMSVTQLRAELLELETKREVARLERQAGKLENSAQVKMISDQIARIKTIVTEKEIVATASNVGKENEIKEEKKTKLHPEGDRSLSEKSKTQTTAGSSKKTK